jgi:hypothetical protein
MGVATGSFMRFVSRLLVCALAAAPALARAEEPSAAAVRPATADNADAAAAAAAKMEKARLREEIKREIASFGMLALLASTAPAAAPAKPSAWSDEGRRAPAAKPGVASGFVVHIGDGPLALSAAPADEPARVATLGRVATAGGGAGVDDLDAFDGGLSRLHTARAPQLPPLLVGMAARREHLPGETIQRVVREHYAGFRLCYENALAHRPRLGGRIAVKFVIDGTGLVERAADAGSNLGDADVVACVVRGFLNLTFPPSKDRAVTVVYPLTLAAE